MTQYFFGDLSSPLPGSTFIDDNLEPWAAALHSMHSGVSRPSYVQTGMMWLDISSTPWQIKVFQGTDDMVVARLDPMSLTVSTVSDGDKGDITVSSGGTDWEINDESVTEGKINSASAPAGSLLMADGTGGAVFSSASGTYTPSLTGITNNTVRQSYPCNWVRIGNTVTVFGAMDVTPTAVNTHTQVGITLPIARGVFPDEYGANGGGIRQTALAEKQPAVISSTSGTSLVRIGFTSGATTNTIMKFWFNYSVT